MNALRNWRAGLLLLLFFGPILAYIGLGALWLAQQPGPLGLPGEWLYYSTAVWVVSGTAFAILADRWTRSKRQVLPPLDWDAPRTFSPFDLQAWQLVREESDRSDAISLQELSEFDTYIDTGRRLARRLAAHYRPLSTDRIEHVPVVEMLTAIQLAAEDLDELCRQVPGGDLITPSHWKKAVVAAGYLQKANDIYTYLLPIFQPATGLARLGAQKLMVQPAWKSMQQNLLRWFFRAYVNRLGTHLIGLYSGRLAIGAQQYRRLTRKAERSKSAAPDGGPLVIDVAGARDSGKTSLIAALERAREDDLAVVRRRLVEGGFDEELAEHLRTARIVEVPGYTATPGGESARDRSTREAAVEQAVDTDLLLLVIDARRDDTAADVRFAQAWSDWFLNHPARELPPALVVVTGVDRPELGGAWSPPHDWERGRGPREEAVRARVAAIRAAMPAAVTDVVAVALAAGGSPVGVRERLLPTLALLLHRAERAALIRQMHHASTRSKARRLLHQFGRQGRRLWDGVRQARRPGEPVG